MAAGADPEADPWAIQRRLLIVHFQSLVPQENADSQGIT
jgi:hypothetical protein